MYQRPPHLEPAALLLGLLLLPCSGAAEIYRWVDDAGRVQYGDRPEGAAAERLEVDEGRAPAAAPPDAAEREERREKLLRAFEEEREQRREARASAAKARAEREARCLEARNRLREYSEAGFLYDRDATGERRILGDAEHAAALAGAREAVEAACGPAAAQ